MAAIRAGATYFGAIFALGFVLGAVRMFVVAPRIGETGAVLAELPLMLAASWIAARAFVRRFRIAEPNAALAMGGFAFALLIAAEIALAASLGTAPGEWLAGQFRLPGALGLAGQLAFAAMPRLVLKTR